MPKKHRFAPAGYNLHITQRGNYGQQIFFTPEDHRFFLSLIAKYAHIRSVDILAYCLMPNHFHLIVQGNQPNSISTFMQALNGQYAQAIHRRLQLLGRFWQNRFYSCVLDGAHLVAALRYVELNPVRANMVPRALDYHWSSAVIHSGDARPPYWLTTATFDQLFTPAEWQQCLAEGQCAVEQQSIRHAVRHASALGSSEFIESLESEFRWKLKTHPSGRPRRISEK